MRSLMAIVSTLLALPASALDQKVVAVWEGYDYRTSGWAYCETLLEAHLAEADFRSPFCEYQHIDDLLGEGWIVDHSVRIEAPLPSGGTMVDGCHLSELKCVGTRYHLVRDEEFRPPPPPAPELKHIKVPDALRRDAADRPSP